MSENIRPDPFFSADQQERLTELMAQWREARDNATGFPTELQTELETLVQTELQATGRRANAQMNEVTVMEGETHVYSEPHLVAN